MAKGYALLSMTVHDKDAFVHDNPELLEGQWAGKKVIILEFPSIQAARDWYHSPEYQACIGLRDDAADGDVVLLEGFDPPKS